MISKDQLQSLSLFRLSLKLRSNKVPAGGAATINGVVYQMLWSLLRASKAKLANDPVVYNGEITESLLILEPIGGGGDLVVHAANRTTVEQLKSRSSGDAWSLREVIESVIPDLYQATFVADDVEYRFVTEGKMGRWDKVYKFFRLLRHCTYSEDSPISDLDDTVELKFGRKKPKDESDCFWELDKYTQLTLFKKIVAEVRRRKKVSEQESENTTARKLRKLLSHFEFVGGQEQAIVKRHVDAHLLAIIDCNDDLDKVRDNICLELMRRATHGGAEINCNTFFEEFGLNAIPLSDIGSIRNSSQRWSFDTLARLGYQSFLDARRSNAETDILKWPVHVPALVITGESGCGKTWRALSLDAPLVINELTAGQFERKQTIYTELIPTLGTIAHNALAELLRQHIDDSIEANWIAIAIAKINGAGAEAIACSFLNSEHPLIRLAAAQILCECPNSETLDRLWWLHNDVLLNPLNYLRDQDKCWSQLLYNKTFSALKSCLKRNPQWVGQQIERTNADSEAISDLAYLLLTIPPDAGSELWNKHKAKLFAVISKEKQRSLAMCIDAFSDTDELAWLIKSAASTEELVGPAALRTLARLNSTAAVGILDSLDQRVYCAAHSWFSEELFVRDLEATRQKLCCIMEKSDDIWQLAQVYDNLFHFMDSATLDLILEAFDKQLSGILHHPDPMPDNGLLLPLRLLVQANSIDQLTHLAKYANSSLESHLVEYVIRVGPRKSLGMDSPTRVNAIDLLLRINGKGFAVAVNCLLASESEYGQSDGLEIAASRPNAETLQRLTAMCDYSEPRNGHYWEQSKAAQILAENSHWEPVVDLVRKIGLQTLTKVTDLPRCGFRPSVNLLQPVVKLAKQNPAEMRPGDLLALGYGTDEHARILAKLKDEFAPGSEEARALVVALEIVKNKSTDNVPFLRNQLVQADRFFNAANALIENGTSEALLALSDNAADDLTGAIAINLINRLPESTDAVKRSQRSIVNAIKSGKSWDLSSDLEYLRRNINDVSKVKQLFEAKEIEEFLRREAFADEGISWSTGSKASTIRCLAILDSDAAFVAAKTALLNHKAHDRDYYPSLLLELDERTGATLLLKQLENESNHVIRTAIGRALGRINTLYFLEVLRDGSDLEKQVVCFACRWQKSSAELKAALKLCIDDKSEKISRQAITTCIALGVQEETLRFAERIMCEKVESERWLILTCLLELADPGDKHHIWPIHCPNIWSILSPLQRSKALKRLNKRQEDETAELKRTTE